MRRREALRGVAAGAAVTALSGCIGGLLDCGPGETKFGDIEADIGSFGGQEVNLKGEAAEEKTDDEFVRNDSTGKADIEAVIGSFDQQLLDNALCIYVTGVMMIEKSKNGDDVTVPATVAYAGEVRSE
jgi:uncharacterized protein YdeI (BOF family)